MKSIKIHPLKSASAALTILLVLLTLSVNAQIKNLKFSVDHEFLKIPAGIHLKEIYDLAINSKAEIFLRAQNRAGATTKRFKHTEIDHNPWHCGNW